MGFKRRDTDSYTVFGTDPLEELSIPDGTHVEEHDLAAAGDVLVGGQSTVELGVRGKTVVAGERVTVEGDIEADGDCRLDMWCEVDGNVLVGDDAYLGERVHITGQLIVSGDLDIGDDVEIEQGFEANGWIVIRNPVPTIVFLFVYLSHLLRVGEKEAAAEVADEFLSEDRSAEPVVIPRGARVSDDSWRVSTPATIGDDCRLHGNIRATSIDVGADTEVFGSLRAKGPIRVGDRTVVHGDVTTRGGDVTIAPGAHVRGDISCDRCELADSAEIEGTIRARDGITLEDAQSADGDVGGTERNEAATARSDAEPEPDPESGEREEPDVSRAVVPLGEGQLPSADGDSVADSRTFVPLEADGTDRAVVPIEAGRIEWDNGRSDPEADGSGGATGTEDRNGATDEPVRIVGDGEE